MITNFESLFRKALIVSGMVLPLVFAGYKKQKENSPPVVSLNVSPTSGDVPLVATINLSGTDPDGEQDIKTYKLTVGGVVTTSSTPISTTKTFDTEASIVISGEVVDSQNARSSDSKTVIASTRPFIYQTVSLVNNVNINYNAILSKINLAQLIITNITNGSTFFTKDLTGNYSNLFTDVPAGSYKGILTAGSFKNEFNIVVPNYSPVLDASKIILNLPEYSVKNYLVSSAISDLNLLDRANAKILDATVLSGNAYVTINKDSIFVRSRAAGNIQIGITYGSTEGGIATTNINGTATPDARVKIDLTAGFGNNRYGSGKAILDNNVFNASDLARMIEIKNKTFSDPNDTWLMHRIDVNGDGKFDDADITIAQKALDTKSYLPGDISNPSQTRAEKVDWIRKMVEIAKVYNFPFAPGVNCNQFSNQLMLKSIPFSTEDQQKFAHVYPYDFTNVGFLGIRMCEVYKVDYDPSNIIQSGIGIRAHLFNGSYVGTTNLIIGTYNINADANIPENWCFIEPQFKGAVDIKPGQYYFFGINAKINIQGPPIHIDKQNNLIMMEQGFKSFIKKNKVITSSPMLDPNIIIINDGYK